MPDLARLGFTVAIVLSLTPAGRVGGLAPCDAAAEEAQPVRPKPAADDAAAGPGDPALAQRVKEAAFIIVSDDVSIGKQHPEHAPLGFTGCRFKCVRPLKGDFGKGLASLMDVALMGFAGKSKSGWRGDSLRGGFVVFIKPLPGEMKKYSFRGILDAPGETVEDLTKVLAPATPELVRQIRALLDVAALPPGTIVAAVEHTGSWGRGLIWRLEITEAGLATYREFEQNDQQRKEAPKESRRLAGDIPKKDLAEFIGFMEKPGLPELAAEDAGMYGYTYRKPGLVFEAYVSAIGARPTENRPNLAKELMSRVEAVKALLKRTE